jgi:hypothetical protein
MDLTSFESNLQKLNLEYNVGSGLANTDIERIEEKLGVSFPEQVKEFYMNFGTLNIRSPRLEIYSPLELTEKEGKIIFCKFKGMHELSFDISELNQANQWNIINTKTGYIVTHTMASFWSNKVWAWLRGNREIWAHEIYS